MVGTDTGATIRRAGARGLSSSQIPVHNDAVVEFTVRLADEALFIEPGSGKLWTFDFGNKTEVIKEADGEGGGAPFQVAQATVDERALFLVLPPFGTASLSEQDRIFSMLREHDAERPVAVVVERDRGKLALIAGDAELKQVFAKTDTSRQGELLRLPTPSYVLYNTLAKIQGATSEEIPFDENWQLTGQFAESKPNLKLVFLPNPNSPSGTTVSQEAILNLANALPCPLLVDEAYADFAEFNCIDLVKQNEKIMVSRTLSKGYGLAGLRFGFLIAQPQIIAELHKVRDSYNCDALSIAGATAAIDDQAWLAENRAKVVATRSRLEQAMRDLGFQVTPSQANFVWCTNPGRSLKPLYEGLKSNKILVRYMDYAD